MAAKIRVLMVDDEAKFRETTSKILQKKGFETTMAGTGEDAVEILRKKPQDVIILDIKMPGMDGHEALSLIKEIQPEVRVIMLTGHGDSESAKIALTKGAYDYLNKPCDIDLLASKINDAYKSAHLDGLEKEEKKAGEIMIRIEDYTTITAEKTVKDAIEQLMRSFEGLVASDRVMETGHRSILIFDRHGEITGILSIQDLISAVRPGYLSAPKPSMADSIQYSPMFWSGLFTTQMLSLKNKKVEDIMSEAPPSVDENTNLMELADLMYMNQIRRVAVTRKGRVVGIVREQEIFFEMANIIV
jgi:DNA-binding response OmpR family regulator